MQLSNVEDTYFQRNFSIRAKDKFLDLSTPIVMAIINTTPDSFFAESRKNTTNDALHQIEKAGIEGAKIVDIGGYSTRPGAEFVSVKEELKRTIPLILEANKAFPELLISIDTFRSEVANAALDTGAHIVNDISGFNHEPEIIKVAANHNAAYVLMHMRGDSSNMTKLTDYENLFTDIASYFSQKIVRLKEVGLHDIILDLGYGFAKNIEQNHQLLKHSDFFNQFDLPILTGVSRKSMIYKKLGITPQESLPGTIALNAIALEKGSKILRVHDVKPAVDLIQLLS